MKDILNSFEVWSDAQGIKSRLKVKSIENISLEGIVHLRELILELAILGKLVPQNSADNSEIELQKKIKYKTDKLTQEGKIKPLKKVAELSKLNEQIPLSKGWLVERLGNISIIERGGSPRPINAYITDAEDGLNWIKISDTSRGGKYINSTAEKIRKDGLTKTRMVFPGDFLLTNSMSFGRPYITNIEGCIHDGWLRIHPPEFLDKDYLYYLLSSNYVFTFFKSAAAGAVVQNLNSEKVRELPIPIPPIDEQKQIAIKVNELMALCDELEKQKTNHLKTHQQLVKCLLETLTRAADANELQSAWQRLAPHFDSLFCTEDSIEQLKQTILQLAVMGKLVKQDEKDEWAEKLLEKIITEKQKLIAQGKLRKEKESKAINPNEIPYKLPKEWIWCKLNEITNQITDGEHLTPPRIDAGYMLLSAKNVRDGYIDYENCDYISKEIYEKIIKRCKPQVGDLLIVSVGGTIGRVSLISENREFAIVRSVALIRPCTLLINKYLELVMNSPLLQKIISNKSRGGAQPCLYLSEIKEFIFPLPPIAEQKRIVAKVEELFVVCEQLKSKVQKAQKIQNTLAETVVGSINLPACESKPKTDKIVKRKAALLDE